MLPAVLALALAANSQTWALKTQGAPHLEVSNVSGSIEVIGERGTSVSVEATQSGGDEKARARREIRVEQRGEDIEVHACCGRCGERTRDCDDDVRVRLVLKVPVDSRLEVSAVSSSVDVQGVSGPQEISSVSGPIQVKDSAAKVEVKNVSGKVELAPAVLQPTQVSTVSGSVRIRLPEKGGARVKLSSVSGRLDGTQTTLGSSSKVYGDGSTRIDVSTVSGSVDVVPPRS